MNEKPFTFIPEINGCYAKKDDLNFIVRVDSFENGYANVREVYSNTPWSIGGESWEAMLPYALPRPTIGSEWVHSNGNTYQVTGLTNLEPGRQEEYPTTVSYRNTENNKPYSRKLVDWYRSMKPRPLTDAEKAYDAFIVREIGWTEFSKIHSATSAKQYKATWIAGFQTAVGMITGSFSTMMKDSRDSSAASSATERRNNGHDSAKPAYSVDAQGKRNDGRGDPSKGEYNAFLGDDGSDLPCD